jgi:hypothetical protein
LHCHEVHRTRSPYSAQPAGENLGHLSFGDMAFLELMARIPTSNDSKMFNAILVTLVEHGLTGAQWLRG